MIIGLRGTIVLPNGALCRMLECPKSRLVGRRLSRIVHSDYAEAILGSLEMLREGREEHVQMDVRFRAETGRYLWANLSLSLFKDRSSRPRFAVAIAADITRIHEVQDELKNAKESAESATRVKSEFLANMSHEIRTPIHTIIGMGELMSETELDAEQKEYANQIQFSAEVLLSLVNDILDFSKIEAGRLSLEVIDFEIAPMVAESLDLIALEAHEKGLELICDIDPLLPRRVKGDPHRIRQIIINLVKNAVKFTAEGEVMLRVELAGGDGDALRVRFSVIDTGIGIPPEKQARLFTAFGQVDSSTSRKYGGSGLGLSISRSLTEMMEGEIGVQSVPDEGSTFWFTVPLKVSETDSRLVSEKDESLSGLRIMIVDDNSDTRAALATHLSAWGCAVSEAAGGEQALRRLRESSGTAEVPELALIDARMSGIDGWQLAQEISSDRSINSTKMILVTPAGKSGNEAKMKLLRWFDGYLSKPVRLSQLRDILIRTTSQTLDLEAVDQGEAEEAVHEPSAENRDIRILIAEDHEVNQALFRSILEKLGYSIDVANDGREALDLAVNDHYNLIFMDIHMPNMNGLEATERIRGSGIRTPIVAVSADAIKEDMQRAMNTGMNDFITKPFKKKDLLPVIDRWAHTGSDAPGSDGPAAPPEPAPPETAPPQSPLPETAPPMDLEMAVETFLGDREVVLNVLAQFMDKAGRELHELEEAVSKSDFERIQDLAHSIKGSSWNLEIRRLGEHAEVMERAAREGDGRAARDGLREAIAAFGELTEFVQERDLLPKASA